jgi:hypothetical protein
VQVVFQWAESMRCDIGSILAAPSTIAPGFCWREVLEDPMARMGIPRQGLSWHRVGTLEIPGLHGLNVSMLGHGRCRPHGA